MTIQGIPQIRALIARESKKVIPSRKGRRIPLPLCCWLQCAKPLDGSRIRGLRESERGARWQWGTWSAGTYHMAERAAAKWCVTNLQYQLLIKYLDRFYDGRVAESLDLRACGLHGDKAQAPESKFKQARLLEFNREVVDLIYANGPSMRVLLSRELTALILITQTRIIL